MGCLLTLWGIAVYIVTGVYSFRMLGVDNFLMALLWLVVWHAVASVVWLIGAAVVFFIDNKVG